MVYSVIYYATEANTRAIISLIFWIKDWLERRTLVERKPPEKPLVPPGYRGFLKVLDTTGAPLYRFSGRATMLDVRVPAHIIDPKLPAIDLTKERPPTRVHFLWAEAASDRWFEDIEKLAEIAERRAKGKRERKSGKEVGRK